MNLLQQVHHIGHYCDWSFELVLVVAFFYNQLVYPLLRAVRPVSYQLYGSVSEQRFQNLAVIKWSIMTYVLVNV